MKLISSVLVGMLTFASFVVSTPIYTVVSYDGYKIYKVKIESDYEAGLIREILEDIQLGVKSWNKVAIGSEAHLQVAPSSQDRFISKLEGVPHSIMIENLQQNIDVEYARTRQNSERLSSLFARDGNLALTAKEIFTDYQDQGVLVAFIASLPGVTQFSLGKTYEGRDITGFTFGTGSKNIVFNGGIHAREWIAPAAATYITHYLTGGSADAVALLKTYTFTVIPVLNPDGYAYTRSTDRMWRKNREPNKNPNCVGTDPNRNFPFKWGFEKDSFDECSETYRGSSAGSTAEAKALIGYMAKVKNVASYIDIHSFGNLILFPYGYTCTKVPEPDYSNFVKASKVAADALYAVHGQVFATGSTCSTIYPASGVTVDYAYSLGTKYAFTFELRGGGSEGFDLSAGEIVPSAEETTASLVALWKSIS
ncbi:hypothetical protein O5D80_002962 [Batrachochytrium dendrobatidis]|nr:hypothetical protein O5D80_002962 [Batrachochytrium dendrobatidis]